MCFFVFGFFFFFVVKKRNHLCSLATERWVLHWEPRAGTAEASSNLSPTLLLVDARSSSPVASPCSRISRSFPPVISRVWRFWPKLPLARALLGKAPLAEEGPPEDAARMEGWEDGLAQRRRDVGRRRAWRGLGFRTVCRLVRHHHPQLGSLSHRCRTFRNLLQPLLNHQPEDRVPGEVKDQEKRVFVALSWAFIPHCQETSGIKQSPGVHACVRGVMLCQ